jgi:hypothetical protein
MGCRGDVVVVVVVGGGGGGGGDAVWGCAFSRLNVTVRVKAMVRA